MVEVTSGRTCRFRAVGQRLSHYLLMPTLFIRLIDISFRSGLYISAALLAADVVLPALDGHLDKV